jgi:hypothetical protein
MSLERAEQLARLHRLFPEARESRGGRVALITGPVGSGTFAEHAAASGVCCLSAAAARAERAVPLGVLGRLRRGAELPPGSAEQVERLWEEAAGRAAFRTERGVDDRVTASAPHGLSQALLDVAVQAHRPLLIGTDDAQDADIASPECLSAFVRKLRRSRVLIVLPQSAHGFSTVPRPPPRRTGGRADARCAAASAPASGYGNRQMGTKLFVTVSMVEQHLSRVHRTLKTGRRSDLTRLRHPDLAPESMAPKIPNLLLDGRT